MWLKCLPSTYYAYAPQMSIYILKKQKTSLIVLYNVVC